MEADLEEIRERIRAISTLVEDQVGSTVRALLEVGDDLANQVILGDRRVNRRIREIDHLCHAFIIRHSPSAGHLRFVSAAMRLDIALRDQEETKEDFPSTVQFNFSYAD